MPSNHPVKPANLSAPGLSWRRRSNKFQGARWEAHWIADQKLVKRGYPVKTERLWSSSEEASTPTLDEWTFISNECHSLHTQMRVWASGGSREFPKFASGGHADTIGELISAYRTDADSPFHELRYRTKLHYASVLHTLDAFAGTFKLGEITFRHFKRWHEGFAADGHVARAHGLMTMIRIVISFGKRLELPNCARLMSVLEEMTFPSPQRRTVFITYQQAKAVIAEAHRQEWHSVALAQASMFETGLRQKDVIGEWIPIGEPGNSDIHWHKMKWLHGLHWRDISPDLVLSKRISKSLRGRRAAATPGAGKTEEFDLKSYPMVMEEFRAAWTNGGFMEGGSRDSGSQSWTAGPPSHAGPLIICEATGRPWTRHFSKVWREIATAAGVPSNVCNKDSRAGGITEGDEAGATLEGLRHHAGHTTTAMTVRYVRGGLKQRNKVAQLRVESRGK